MTPYKIMNYDSMLSAQGTVDLRSYIILTYFLKVIKSATFEYLCKILRSSQLYKILCI